MTPTTGIRIVKAINAANPNAPTAQEDANDADLPLLLTQGAVPVYTFQVSNLGTQALKDIVVRDDAATSATANGCASPSTPCCASSASP